MNGLETWRGRGAHLALVALVLASAEVAAADPCAVLSNLPAKITTPGNYCLGSTLRLETPTEAAITIEADAVVLDLRGQTLEAGPGSALRKAGIFASGRRGVTVRNGLVSGFDRGIALEGSAGGSHLIERVRIENSRDTGLTLEGRGNVTRKTQIVGAAGGEQAIGIRVSGPLARILASEIRDTGAKGWRGVVVDRADGAVIENNRVGSQGRPAGTVGIDVSSSKDVLLMNNDVINVMQRVRWAAGSTGARRDVASAARGKAENQ